MINFTFLNSIEEKLLVLFLHVSKPQRQSDIIETLRINKSSCIKNLKKLLDLGIITKTTNEYGISFYSLPYEQGTFCVPQGMQNVPQGMQNIPQGMQNIPQGMQNIPQGMQNIPQGMQNIPQGMQNIPKNLQNSGQIKFKNKSKSNKERENFVEEVEESLATAKPLPAAHTKLVTAPKKKPTPTPQRPDMPTINIPRTFNEKECFDGFIYAREFPHEKYLDRMIEMIGFGTIRNNSTLESYEFFKKILDITFQHFIRMNRKKPVFDEVVHRVAFAVTMETPELRNELDLKQFLDECKQENNTSPYLWRVTLRRLMKVYWHQQWGWDDKIYTTSESWDNEKLTRPEPRIELFPARRYQLLSLQENPQKKLTPKQYEKAEEEKIKQMSREEAREMWIKAIRINPNNIIASRQLSQNYGMTPEQLQQIIHADSLEDAMLITPNTLEIVTEKKQPQKVPQTTQPQAQSPEEAKKDYLNMLRKDPNNTYLHNFLIRQYKMTKKEIEDFLQPDALAVA